jgi:hypothetical protein
VKVTIRRTDDTVYGPVANFFGGIFGFNTSQVSATATAYLGYTDEVVTGSIQVPLALPNTVLTASKGHSGWFAWLLAPREAVASTTKTYIFKDTGGGFVNTNVTSANPLDPAQAYLYTVGKNDSVPNTIWDILTKVYTPGYSSGNPVYVTDLKLGQQIYPRSEFMYGNSYIGPIFQRLQKAYNYKTTGNASKAPAAGTPWRTTFAVYGTNPNPTASRPRQPGFRALARLLGFFCPTEAFACYTMPPPSTYVSGFVNADITGVSYNSSGDEGNYTYPKTVNGVKYKNKKDFLTNYPTSVWNVNSVTIKNVTDANTISPPGSLSGGPSNQTMNPAAPANTGAFASIPRLVK